VIAKNPNVAKNTLKDIDEDLTYSNINFVLTKAILLNSLLSLIGSDLSYRRGLEPRSVRSEINKSSAVGVLLAAYALSFAASPRAVQNIPPRHGCVDALYSISTVALGR
jgi:hypothetical protein